MIRYTLTPDFKHIILDDGTKKRLAPKGIFVDLLETMEEGACELISVTLHLPDGQILKGKVVGMCITLSSRDELFDGRFNFIQLSEHVRQLEVEVDPKVRLEYLRGELRAERISYGELDELQSLIEHIDSGDLELLEAAGVPEETEVDE